MIIFTEQDTIIEKSFRYTLYAVCAFDNDQIIGYTRLIGDKTLFLYIQDVMVIPEFQGKKINSQLMKFILKEVARLKFLIPNIRTYLGASKNKENFYRKFGFVPSMKNRK